MDTKKLLPKKEKKQTLMFQVQATITKITTMSDKGIRLQVDTQEVVGEEAAMIFNLKDMIGWFLFKEVPIKSDDLNLPDFKMDVEQKTPSQRLRNSIFRWWESTSKEEQDFYKNNFDLFYVDKMEKYINHAKGKINV